MMCLADQDLRNAETQTIIVSGRDVALYCRIDG